MLKMKDKSYPVLFLYLLMSSADNFCKQFWTQTRPGLIRIQTVRYSKGIPEINFSKKNVFENVMRPTLDFYWQIYFIIIDTLL